MPRVTRAADSDGYLSHLASRTAESDTQHETLDLNSNEKRVNPTQERSIHTRYRFLLLNPKYAQSKFPVKSKSYAWKSHVNLSCVLPA